MIRPRHFGPMRWVLAAMVFFFLSCLFVAIPSDPVAETRGITVKARTGTGATREIKLYSGYHALVVGCGAYHAGWPQLPNPVKDAREVSTALRRMGCAVDLLVDPDWSTLRRALNALITGPGRDQETAVLFWFSGHGHTLKEAGGRELGYIVPVDAPNPDRDEIGFRGRAISMREIETLARGILSRHALMLFDSCFSGAIFQAVRSKPSRYIEEKVRKPVRQFITAGSKDEQVPDQSVFKTVFIQGIGDGYADRNADGYVTGMELGDYLQEQVINYSRGAQHPQFGKINDPELDKGDFIFLLPDSGTIKKTPPSDREENGRLSVTSNVSGAKVHVDGNFTGDTPLAGLKLSAGSHRIQVEKSGYEAYRKTITVFSGRSATLEAYLKVKGPTTGRLYVKTSPREASVRILNFSSRFYQGMALSPGRYHLEVFANGYESKKTLVTLKSGDDNNISVNLSPLGTLSKNKVPQTFSGISLTEKRKISREDSNFLLFGTAKDNKSVADFMKELEENELFKGVTLLSMKKKGAGKMFSFRIIPIKKASIRSILTPLEKIDLSQIKIATIQHSSKVNNAVVKTVSGEEYLVTKGTYIGIHSGRVVEIRKDKIVIEELNEDISGLRKKSISYP